MFAAVAERHLPRRAVRLHPSPHRRIMATLSASDKDRYLADLNAPVCGMNVGKSFAKLTRDEKLYSHWMGRASWAGARVIMNQWTPRAEQLYDFIIAVFASAESKTVPASFDDLKAKSGLSSDEFALFADYCAQVLSNLCNYKSFGSSKFIPRCPPSAFEAVIKVSHRHDEAMALWEKLKVHIYALDPSGQLDIGKPSAGHLSNYYPDSPSITDDEINAVQALCDTKKLSTLNTRLFKKSATEFSLIIASGNLKAPVDRSMPATPLKGDHGLVVHLQYGDFSDSMVKVCSALKEAQKYCGSDLRKEMLEDYRVCFSEGDMNAHIRGSQKWVKDVGPVVETYIGHIEAYVDPFAQRAEWEGFVSIVNKELSQKFDTLVNSASELVKTLPWGKAFEVDVFKRPDFTALEVLTFATGGIPAGINIPNYFEVREKIGFKNVSLANILAAKAPNEEITFVHPSERELYKAWDSKTFDLQVANHELLGHGSGKLLQENSDGTFNFDPKNTINPLTGKPVTSWYKPGETYGSKCGLVASSMEECRAESVALYLCSNRDILKIFGYTSEEDIETMQYMTFLLMARAGVRAMEWYDPKTQKHGQAHMQARFGITKWLLENDIVSLQEVRASDQSLEDAYIKVDREAVLKRGKEVMGRLLVELQVRKSTADGKGASAFYNELTTPAELWTKELRQLVLKKKQPRKMFCQPNTFIKGSSVELKEYELNSRGVIESFIERDV